MCDEKGMRIWLKFHCMTELFKEGGQSRRREVRGRKDREREERREEGRGRDREIGRERGTEGGRKGLI